MPKLDKTKSSRQKPALGLLLICLQMVLGYLAIGLVLGLVYLLAFPSYLEDSSEVTAPHFHLVNFWAHLLILAGITGVLGYYFGRQNQAQKWWKRLDLSQPRWRDIAAGVGLALPTSLIIFAVISLLDWLGWSNASQPQQVLEFMPTGGWDLVWFIGFAALIIPIIEELIFRRWFYRALADKLQPAVAIGVSSLAFGLAHYESLHVVVGATIFGLSLVLLYRWSKNLWAPIAMHVANNLLALGLFYFGYVT